MTDIVCDNCEKTFKAKSARAGGKMPCPYCGDINRIPEGAADSARAEADSEPIDRAVGEREIKIIRPAMFRAHPFRYLFILALFFGGIAGAIFAFRTETAAWLAWPALVVSLVALVWFSIWWLTAHLWVRLIISDRRSVRHEGIIRRHTTEVLHDHVRSVDINQNFLQRILRVGDIGIDSSGQEGIEIEVADIPGPYDVKKLIDRYRKM